MSGLSPSQDAVVFMAPISPNVTSDHVREIMGNFGSLRAVELLPVQTPDGDATIARVAYESAESVESAVKHMDKGEVDGLRVRLTVTQPAPEDLPKMTV
ncbi:ribonucleic acid binding protein S1, putative [Babesia caballi]|uniref:Ribonucleic acid binding protein S1, putative n=1 Tax=Babesia caballi TaxID=5871 RepID=A0AAV4LMU3_BABCB|nr:ribonucleic acid binding protein S1, putative [Babesia caballi]